MPRFHINPAKKSINPCRAEVGNCPFGGESGVENHFENLQEAKAGYENFMKGEKLKTLKKEEFIKEHNSVKNIEEKIKEVTEKHNKIKFTQRGIEKKTPNFVYSDKWFQMNQEKKNLHYEKMLLEEERLKALSPELEKQERVSIEDKKVAKQLQLNQWFEGLKERGEYSYHPEITNENEEKILDDLTAFSGRSREMIKDDVANLMLHNGLNRTQAYQEVWSELPMRKDKPIVAIDLETSNPHIDGKMDTGPYSTIIEVGYVKYNPATGKSEKKSYFAGIPENLKKTLGAGASDVHHITNEMVEGHKPFVEDEEKQNELLNDLKGSVMLAHNAKFENNMFKHNLKGYNRALGNNEIEIIDTRDISSYLMPENEDNTNKTLVENTGGEYKGAHRAFEDSLMTLNALFRSKNIPEVKF